MMRLANRLAPACSLLVLVLGSGCGPSEVALDGELADASASPRFDGGVDDDTLDDEDARDSGVLDEHDDAGTEPAEPEDEDAGGDDTVNDDTGSDHDGGSPAADASGSDVGDAGGHDDDSAPFDAGTVVEPPPPPPPASCAAENDAPAAPGTRPAINADARYLQVYVNNIENLKTASEQCAGDWTDLIFYMKSVKPSPDLFLVQQISNQAQLDVLVQRMTDELPGVFAGIIADADPWTQGSPCGPEKAQQTNAIIYRTGRFAKVGSKHVWQSWAWRNGECRRNHQARTRNVMQKLHDKIANKDITVASLHWSTAQGTGADPACAKKNVVEADQKLHKAGFGGELLIFGGDMNEPDRNSNGSFRPWYREANGELAGALHFRDPIYRACKQGAANTQQCLDDNFTIGSGRRIDFLFAQDGEGCMPGSRRAHTVTFNEADAAAQTATGGDSSLNYSDHRAIRAEIYY